jgi:uncharacterized membrane protein YebE (DUF533 family)
MPPSDAGPGTFDEDVARRRASDRPPPRRGMEDDAPDTGPSGPGGGGLEDILRDILGGGRGVPGSGGGRSGGIDIDDILRRMQQGGGGGGGGLGDILGQIFGQGAGRPPGTSRLGDTAQFSDQFGQLSEKFGQLTGRSPDELLAQLKALVANNQFGAGAAVGGLGALILGTSTGRSLAASAAKLGGLALIGGLAYKAYQNYQQGQPVPAGGAKAPQQQLLAPPSGSGFEASVVTHDHATTLIRAMVAAAAADGRIDAKEQQKLIGSLRQGGLDQAAQEFLANEIEHPASIDDLAAGVTSPEEAVQVYTAARVTIDPDDAVEHEFLAALAERLGIDDDLAAHIDAAARGAGA